MSSSQPPSDQESHLTLYLSKRGLTHLPSLTELRSPNFASVFSHPSMIQEFDYGVVTRIFLQTNRLTTLQGLSLYTSLRDLHMNYSVDAEHFDNKEQTSGVNPTSVGKKLVLLSQKGSSGTITRSRKTVLTDTKIVDEQNLKSLEALQILNEIKTDAENKETQITQTQIYNYGYTQESDAENSRLLTPPLSLRSSLTSSSESLRSSLSSSTGSLRSSLSSSSEHFQTRGWDDIKTSNKDHHKRRRLVILPVGEFSALKELKYLTICGCSISPSSLVRCIGSLHHLENLQLDDNVSLSAFICGPQPENSTSNVSTFSVGTLETAFSSSQLNRVGLTSSTNTLQQGPTLGEPNTTKRKPCHYPYSSSSWFLFKSLSSTLQILSLSKCYLRSFPLSICQCSVLTTLDLSRNPIRRLHSSLLLLTSLTSLCLDQTKLSELPSSSFFSPLSNLKDLSLARNSFTAFPFTSECLLALPSLTCLDLSYNDIPRLGFPIKTLEDASHISKIHLAGNPLSLSMDDPEHIPVQLAHLKNLRCTGCFPDEILPNLYLGNVMSGYNKHYLNALGVTHVLTLIAHWTPIYPNLFKYKLVDVEDKEDVDIKQFFPECVDFIKQVLDSGGCILVHCAAGVSRSASIVLAYLIREKRMTVRMALEHVRRRREICPNLGFIRQLEQWEAQEMPLVYWANKISNALF